MKKIYFIMIFFFLFDYCFLIIVVCNTNRIMLSYIIKYFIQCHDSYQTHIKTLIGLILLGFILWDLILLS